jgi:hypothetical protein
MPNNLMHQIKHCVSEVPILLQKVNITHLQNLPHSTCSFLEVSMLAHLESIWRDRDTVSHNCILVRTQPWRWQEYRPKHVDENIVNKVHHRILTCILLVIYIFLNKILICLSHSEMSEHFLPVEQHALFTWCSQKTTSEYDREPCNSSPYIHNLFLSLWLNLSIWSPSHTGTWQNLNWHLKMWKELGWQHRVLWHRTEPCLHLGLLSLNEITFISKHIHGIVI